MFEMMDYCKPNQNKLTIISQGDVGVYFFVIHKGKVSVFIDGEYKTDLTAGDGFGELALVSNMNRTASVIARDSEVRLLALHMAHFQSYLNSLTRKSAMEARELLDTIKFFSIST